MKKPIKKIEVSESQWLLVYSDNIVEFRYVWNSKSKNEIICQFSTIEEVGKIFVKGYLDWIKNNNFTLKTKYIEEKPYVVQYLIPKE